MRFVDDDKILKKVDGAIQADLKDRGYTSHPGVLWTMQNMRNENLLPDQDWSSPEVISSNIATLVEEAIKWMNKFGFIPVQKVTPSKPRTQTFTSLAWVYRTVSDISSMVNETRQLIWGSSAPPFANDIEGRDLALSWFKKEIEGDAIGHTKGHFGQISVELTLESDDVSKLAFAAAAWTSLISPDYPRSGEEGFFDLYTIVKMFADWNLVGGQVRGGFEMSNGRYPHLALEFTNKTGQAEIFDVYKDTKLAELAMQVLTISRQTGWWNTRETLDYILFAFIPVEFITADTRQFPNGPVMVTLNLRGPATVSDVTKAYREVLEAFNLNPKPLTPTHEAVLSLVFQTPNHSWAERYEVWLQWCDEHPYLPDFNRNPKAGPPSLYNTYMRANNKAKW